MEYFIIIQICKLNYYYSMKSASNKNIYVKIVLYHFKSGLETVTKLIGYRVNCNRNNFGYCSYC